MQTATQKPPVLSLGIDKIGQWMRRIRYRVACSLDGYIAGPNGEFDWIVSDPEMDFAALFKQFDTFIMGRRTYEIIPNGGAAFEGMKVIVVSTTLRQEGHPD